jgi:hypothetical protein
MKAIIIRNCYNIDQIEVDPHFPESHIIDDHQVKVRQWFFSPNPSDAKLHQRHMCFISRYYFHFPKILG